MPEIKDLTGKTLSNRYEILRPLGEGGMGKVYLAKDKRFGKQVVVKVPTMEVGDKDFKDRFMREIVSVATLEHAHIVTTIDWGELDGIPFMVLKYLAGGNLRDRITDAQGFYKPMPLEGLIQWLPQIASALDYIHSKNWVHRDLKPDNILFDETGNPYLADFGIAKALEGTTMGVKTTMGAFIGTPQYMAPEMHLGKGIGPRADQFGLAVLVYEALAGQIPFAGATPTAIFVEVMQCKAKPIHELVPGISVEKSNALMKGISKEPRDRYGSCIEFANAVTGSMLSRVVIPGKKIETPQKAVISGTKIETPQKPEFPSTRKDTPSKPEIAGTKLEKTGSKPEVSLVQEDSSTSEGKLLAQLCRDLVEAGKVTKELYLNARQVCKNDEVKRMAGGVQLVEKIKLIEKTGHVSKEISEEIVSLARAILGLEKPEIKGIRIETPFRVEVPKTQMVAEELIDRLGLENSENQSFSGLTKKRNNESSSASNQLLVWIGAGMGVLILIISVSFVYLSADPKAKKELAENKAKEVQQTIAKSINKGVEKVAESKAKEVQQTIAKSINKGVEKVAESKAKSSQQVATKSIKREVEEFEDLANGIKLEMVLIPAGKFLLGSPKDEKDRSPDEDQHEVTITKPFYMGKYEVTQEQWESVMGGNPSRDKGAKLPVTNVSWDDCQDFIKKLNAKGKGGYRLPTEAEWEYACRAGTKTAYSFGDSITPQNANCGMSKIGKPVAVGSYIANAFGLYDMHGNVWEWCEDWYGAYPKGPITDPKGPVSGERPMVRGGGFEVSPWSSRSAARNRCPPERLFDYFGFRLVRTIGAESVTKPLENKPEVVMPVVELKGLLETPFTEIKAKSSQQTIAKSINRGVEESDDLGNGIKFEMALIPSGKFMMGSPKREKDRDIDEDQHEVIITKPFYMGKYEVTQEQWESVMGKNPSNTKGAKLPVTNVSWDDCQEFIKKLNAKTKGGYRLPTEAEWEYSCRAGTTTAYCFGDTITPKNANNAESKFYKPVVVGSYKANAFGLYDMHGNAWEWCEDRYGGYAKGAAIDPKGADSGERRVLRGGSFNVSARTTRSANRGSDPPGLRVNNFGFRLVRTY